VYPVVFQVMNIKCPYCGCCYEVSNDMLKEPIGNEKLGYGWWLRCYKCHKKWWLKNSTVENSNTPPTFDKLDKIGRISALTKKRQSTRGNPKSRLTKCIILVIVLGAIGLCYQYRSVFYDYLITKAKRLSDSVVSKVALTDVKYDIEDGNMLRITGNVINYDERIISRINGVRISVLDDKSMVLTWGNDFEDFKILPQQKVPFSASKQLPGEIKNMRVEVSIF